MPSTDDRRGSASAVERDDLPACGDGRQDLVGMIGEEEEAGRIHLQRVRDCGIRGGLLLGPGIDGIEPGGDEAREVTLRCVPKPGLLRGDGAGGVDGDPHAPLGAKGVGEPPTVSSTPAVVAAIRDAIGKDLSRVPVRPSDICW